MYSTGASVGVLLACVLELFADAGGMSQRNLVGSAQSHQPCYDVGKLDMILILLRHGQNACASLHIKKSLPGWSHP